jgi:hypothetical protein
MKEDSDSDLSEEMHDQLSELWTSAQIKRKIMLEKLTHQRFIEKYFLTKKNIKITALILNELHL